MVQVPLEVLDGKYIAGGWEGGLDPNLREDNIYARYMGVYTRVYMTVYMLRGPVWGFKGVLWGVLCGILCQGMNSRPKGFDHRSKSKPKWALSPCH